MVAIPGYRPERVSSRLLAGTYAEYAGHDVLFQLGPKEPRVDTVQITHANHSLFGTTCVTTEEVRVAAKQEATVVQDVHRLIVRHRIEPIKLEAPAAQYCQKLSLIHI